MVTGVRGSSGSAYFVLCGGGDEEQDRTELGGDDCVLMSLECWEE